MDEQFFLDGFELYLQRKKPSAQNSKAMPNSPAKTEHTATIINFSQHLKIQKEKKELENYISYLNCFRIFKD